MGSMDNHGLYILVFFAMLWSLAMPVSAQQLPPYTEVVEKYYDLYHPRGVDDGWYVEFEKHADGWYIKIIKSESQASELFWSAPQRQYQQLSYLPIKNKEENEIAKKNALNPRAVYYYNVMPYYGYIGWDADLIDAYGNEPALSDTLLYALAKAYNAYSLSTLYGDMRWADTSRLVIPADTLPSGSVVKG